MMFHVEERPPSIVPELGLDIQRMSRSGGPLQESNLALSGFNRALELCHQTSSETKMEEGGRIELPPA